MALRALTGILTDRPPPFVQDGLDSRDHASAPPLSPLIANSARLAMHQYRIQAHHFGHCRDRPLANVLTMPRLKPPPGSRFVSRASSVMGCGPLRLSTVGPRSSMNPIRLRDRACCRRHGDLLIDALEMQVEPLDQEDPLLRSRTMILVDVRTDPPRLVFQQGHAPVDAIKRRMEIIRRTDEHDWALNEGPVSAGVDRLAVKLEFLKMPPDTGPATTAPCLAK